MEECPGFRLDPPENPKQKAINALSYLEDERDSVRNFLRNADFFHDEWQELLDLYDDAIDHVMSDLEVRCV